MMPCCSICTENSDIIINCDRCSQNLGCKKCFGLSEEELECLLLEDRKLMILCNGCQHSVRTLSRIMGKMGKLKKQVLEFKVVADEKELSELEKCLKALKVGEQSGDPEEERKKRAKIVQEYEDSLKHLSNVQPYGIKDVKTTCAYPIHIGDVKSGECVEEDNEEHEEGGASYTPKHIDTPEEVLAKHYAAVQKEQHEICHGKHVIECSEPPPINADECHKIKEERPKPLMISKPELPPGACKVKTVKFADEEDRCNVDRYDLCGLKKEKTHCDCTKYEKC